MALAYILTGTNLGDKKKNLKNAIDVLIKEIGEIIKMSSVYESEPWGFEHDNSFYNQVLIVETSLKPKELLRKLQAIENTFGRQKKKEGYGPRTLDLDILFFDDIVIEESDLKIPHDKLDRRKFTLLPLFEISPNYFHPLKKKPVKELLENCTDRCWVIKKYQ